MVNKNFFLFFFFILWLLGFAINKADARLVMVIYGQDCAIATQEEAQSFAITEALLAETEEYLAQRIPDDRRSFFRQYLHMISQGLVLKVIEVDNIILENEKKRGAFDVTIRKGSLQSLLRDLGTPYTLDSLQPYVLQTDIPEVAKNSIDISLLEKVSGVTQCAHPSLKKFPAVHIKKEDEKWTAILRHTEGEPIEEIGLSLDMVWRCMWSKFFAQRQTREALDVEEYLLQVSGWRNGSSVEELDQVLKNWVCCVQDLLLCEVNFNKTVIAQWTISLTNKKLFEEKMTQYALAHKLEYTLTSNVLDIRIQ